MISLPIFIYSILDFQLLRLNFIMFFTYSFTRLKSSSFILDPILILYLYPTNPIPLILLIHSIYAICLI